MSLDRNALQRSQRPAFINHVLKRGPEENTTYRDARTIVLCRLLQSREREHLLYSHLQTGKVFQANG